MVIYLMMSRCGSAASRQSSHLAAAPPLEAWSDFALRRSPFVSQVADLYSRELEEAGSLGSLSVLCNRASATTRQSREHPFLIITSKAGLHAASDATAPRRRASLSATCESSAEHIMLY
jgi:hypothetical protein